MVSKKQLHTFGNAVLISKLQYAISVFGNTFLSDMEPCQNSALMKRLQGIQNRYLRFVTNNKLKDKVPIAKMLEETLA